MAAIGACAGFGAICGSSLATAATMGQVALPELKRAGYAGSLASGALAAGGTLGILIPPSIVLVIYAILAEQNIAKLFAAAFIPGILAALGYMLVINLMVRLNPKLAGSIPPMPWPDRLKALGAVWPVLIIFVVVVGGIYTGLFTPTEGAAVGAVATGLLAWQRGGMSRKKLQEAFESTAGGTAMVFMIVLGAAAYNTFLALSQLPQELAAWVGAQGFSPYAVLWAIMVFYLIFGCVMDSLSMILLTIPIFFPMVSGLDFGLPPEETGHLVRHHRADRRGSRVDHATGGYEPVRHPVDGAVHQHPRDLPRRLALRRQRPDPRDAAGDLPGDHAVHPAAVMALPDTAASAPSPSRPSAWAA